MDCPEFRKFCYNLGIKKGFLAVIHLQANGQVEVINKVLKQNLKMKLDSYKGAWPKKLPNVLWAYRAMTRMTTGETPFSLAYGYEAMIPVEINVSLLRRKTYDQETNHELLRTKLDLVEERKDASQLRVAAYQSIIERYFNSKV